MPTHTDNQASRRAHLLARLQRAEKAYNPHAKAGETISGKLKRGGDGKFTSGGTGATETPDAKAKRIIAEEAAKPTPVKGGRRAKLKTRKAPKTAKPKTSPEERQRVTTEKRTIAEAKNHDAIATALAGKLGGLDFANVMSFADGKDIAPDKLKTALAQGLLEQGTDGSIRLSAAGRGLKQAADRGDVRQALDSLSKGHDAVAKRLALEARRAALQARRKPKSRQRTLDTIQKRITTYKSLDGKPRWLSVTTTAFKDRQAEILSTFSLEQDVARSYKSIAEGRATDHGPLLFWHTPIELGRCDWRHVEGHSLIESGYFHSEKEASYVKPSDQMSPGFYHLLAEPDTAGVFRHIAVIERSVTPARRAANPYTLITKEADVPNITPEKAKEYLDRGGEEGLLASLLAAQAQTEDTLIAAGVSHKAMPAAVAVEPDEGTPDEEAQDAATGEMDEAGGSLFSAEDAPFLEDVIGRVLDARLAPVMAALDIQKTVAGHMQALQQSYAKKEAADKTTSEQLAALVQQNVALEMRLKELEGDQPSVWQNGGYRASADSRTVVHREKDAPSPQSLEADPWEAHMKGMGFAPATKFVE